MGSERSGPNPIFWEAEEEEREEREVEGEFEGLKYEKLEIKELRWGLDGDGRFPTTQNAGCGVF